jgi:hypothetical protein
MYRVEIVNGYVCNHVVCIIIKIETNVDRDLRAQNTR